jgi:hypothetical protein
MQDSGSGCGLRHGPTAIRAFTAGPRALLAVLGLVLRTFGRTGFAELRTNATDVHGPVTSHAHELRSRIANSGAFHVCLNTARHHVHIFFLRARRSTMVADGSATQAGLNTFPILMITTLHKLLFVD